MSPRAALLLASFALLACGPLSAVPANTAPQNVSPSGASSTSTRGVASTSATSSTTSGGAVGLFPAIPNNGGGVLAAPRLVVVTFNGDPNQQTMEADAAWVATGGYLATVGEEYGVGNGSVLLSFHSDATPPGLSTVETFLLDAIGDGTLPAYDPSNLYVVTIPASSPATADYCARDQGYHSYFFDGDHHRVIYAVIPNCSGDVALAEVTLAHEVIEAATDPTLETYQIQDPQNPWSLLGGEVADLCASVSVTIHDPSGRFSAPLVWSNAAASAAQIPCGPWPGTSPFMTLVPAEASVQKVAPGGSFSVTLTGWASAPNAGDCQLTVAGQTIGDFAANPTVSGASLAMGAEISVTLSVPASARSGQRGGAWIGCTDRSTGQILGSTLVAVEATDEPGGR